MTVVIRKAELNDVTKLLPLYDDLGYPSEETQLRERLNKIFSDDHYGCLVAQRNGELLGLLGYAKLYFFEDDGSYYRILALSVRSSARRQGIATALMNEVKKIALKDGARVLALNSGLAAARSAAYQFYEHYGFERLTTGFGLSLQENGSEYGI